MLGTPHRILLFTTAVPILWPAEPAVRVRDKKLLVLFIIFTLKCLTTDVSVNSLWRKELFFSRLEVRNIKSDMEAIVRKEKES